MAISNEKLTEICNRVMREGKPFIRSVVDEGDAETGPYAFTSYGWRLGQVSVEIAENGSASLNYPADWDRWSLGWEDINRDTTIYAALEELRSMSYSLSYLQFRELIVGEVAHV